MEWLGKMEKLNNAKLILRDQSYITYSTPEMPHYTTDEVDFWLVTDAERVLLCKDSIAEIVSRGGYVLENNPNLLQEPSELDEIASLYCKTFLTKHYQDMRFDKHMFLVGVGYITWLSYIENFRAFYLRIDYVYNSKKHRKIFSGLVDKVDFLSWWDNVKLKLQS